MSAPATNALSPAPVRITQRTPASRVERRRTPRSARPASAPSSALRASGRLTVTVATAPVARRRARSRASTAARLVLATRPRERPAARRRRVGVLVEAAPALAAEPAGGDVLAQQRAGPVLRSPSSRCSTSAIARQVSRPIRSASASGPIGWLRPSWIAGVDVLDRAEALVEREAGLVEQRDQHAVDDEARDVARHDGRLAEPLGQRARRLVGRVAGRAGRGRSRPASSAAPGS